MTTESTIYPSTSSAVVSLTDRKAQDLAVTGGKGANLANLVELGFAVPDGFCVTTAVYDRLADDEQIRQLVDRLEATEADDDEELRRLAALLREAIREHRLSGQDFEAIEQQVDPQSIYVTRSSATAEDLPTASFTGQHGIFETMARLLPVGARSVFGIVKGAVTGEYLRIAHRARQWADRMAADPSMLLSTIHSSLQSVDRVYTLDELIEALDNPNHLPQTELHDRFAQHRWHRQLTPPRVITSDGEIPRGVLETGPLPGDFDGLVGTPTSGGTAEGVVRVIREPAGARLRSGEILVAPHTDPGWTPLFLNAAGLVTDEGGEMTHGSLVAREYGIPSVVVAGATEQLESGQHIRVDGNRGTVEVLDEP